MRPGRLAILVSAVVLARTVVAQQPAEWAQWRGPDRTGLSKETGLLKLWPAGGPKLLAKFTGLGEGYTTPSFARGRIFGMGLFGEEEKVWALDANGQVVWATKIAGLTTLGGRQGGFGPRSTPTVEGDLLWAEGVGGDIVCLEAATGKLRWQKNLVSDFGGRVPQWGYSESPLLDGNQVIITPGGRTATVVALNKLTGEVVWKCVVPEGDPAGYASPIVIEFGGVRQYVQFLGRGVVGVAAKDGQFLWRYNAPANGTANCSTPLYHDGHVFAASGYNNGGGLAKLTADGGAITATQVYFSKSMLNHHGGMVRIGDHLYGFDNATLTCLDWKTGDVKWANRSVGKGSVFFADGHLIARSERGPVALVEATPTGYLEKGQFIQPERTTNPAWAHPVVVGGKLYLRDQDALFVYELSDRR